MVSPYNNVKKQLFILMISLAIGCKNDVTPPRPVSQGTVKKIISGPTIKVNDPVLCYGSTAGILPYFYMLLQTQNFSSAIGITDPRSMQRLGRERVMKFYRGIDVSYSPKLLSIIRFGCDSAQLRYRVRAFATARFATIRTVLVHDSVKLVLPQRLGTFLR